MLVCIYYLFINKRILSKIAFSQEYIKITWLKKEIYEFRWHDITNVTTTLCGKGSRYLTLFVRDKSIDMIPSNKIFKAIMISCPFDSIKEKVVDIFKNHR